MLSSFGSQALDHRLNSCDLWYFLDQGLNPCLLHWQVQSLPLSHEGSPLLLWCLFSNVYINEWLLRPTPLWDHLSYHVFCVCVFVTSWHLDCEQFKKQNIPVLGSMWWTGWRHSGTDRKVAGAWTLFSRSLLAHSWPLSLAEWGLLYQLLASSEQVHIHPSQGEDMLWLHCMPQHVAGCGAIKTRVRTRFGGAKASPRAEPKLGWGGDCWQLLHGYMRSSPHFWQLLSHSLPTPAYLQRNHPGPASSLWNCARQGWSGRNWRHWSAVRDKGV